MTAPRALTEAEKAKVQAVRRDVYALAPDAVFFIESMVQQGLIHGWRNVVCCRTHAEADAARDADPGITLTASQFRALGNIKGAWNESNSTAAGSK